MKLIYIANARIPTEKAHGIQIMKMCEAFARSDTSKIEVELIIPRRFNPIKIDPFEYYNVERIFRIKRLPCLDLIPLDFFLGNLALWIQTITFLISAKIYLFLKSVEIRGLTSVAIRKPYDILYTREQLVGLFFKDFVLEIHSLPSNIKTFHKKIWQKAKALIVLTSFIKKRLVEAGISENKILIVPDGVDLEKFVIDVSKQEAQERLNLPKDKKIILYSGSFYLYDWKGIAILLEAVKYFEKDWVLILVGGNKNEIEEIRKKYNLDKVLLIERRPHSEIPYYLKAADVLVIPNKKGDQFSEEYTSPLKLFEYMASGVPIVASDLPSIRDILYENKRMTTDSKPQITTERASWITTDKNQPKSVTKNNAVLVEPNNPEALAGGIKRVLQNNDLADRISKQALQDVQNYTWQKRVENILKFIKNANN
jgi:glycosyltransferase involved in cell wall biosynthesis